jgi:transcriptional regulator GlxA family with amidase domain
VQVVALVFEGITALDVVGPYEVLQRVPGVEVRFVARAAGPVRSDNGYLGLHADHAIADVSSADVLVVPGGFGARALERDAEVLDWIRAIDATTTWTTSVCTGALVLGAAGLLEGLEATTHWMQLERLREYGATPTSRRVVEQGKYVTAAGVSSGIDMALVLAERLVGPDVARAIQLSIEYDPQPPFDAGSPEKAGADIVALVRAAVAAGAK